MFVQVGVPVAGSLGWSCAVTLLPRTVLIVLLAGLRTPAWRASLVCLAVGVTAAGSVTSSNALFAALQVDAARQTGLSPLPLTAANSSGGAIGKMISVQNLVIAAAAVALPGAEGLILRRLVLTCLLVLLGLCLLLGLQAAVLAGWRF
jgi:L-lactate permease